MKNLTAMIAVVTLGACSLTAARAGELAQTRAVPVRFAEVDIASASAVAALYQRIQGAAERSCRDLLPGPVLGLVKPYEQCVRGALVDAIQKVNRQAVSAYAHARGLIPAVNVTVASK